MNWFRSASLSTRILLIVGFACTICAVIAMGVSIHFNEVELEKGIIKKSRTIHSRLEAATEYIAKQGGLKPVVERLRQKYTDPSLISPEEKIEVLKQVPIFAAMKIGAQGAKDENYVFRVFSDEPRRKENRATAAEFKVLERFLDEPTLHEIIENTEEAITVYRPVRLSEAQGCLLCHGNPTQSPWGNGKDILGYKMENWRDGKLHGVFAITSKISEVKAAQAGTETFSTTTHLALFIIGGGLIAQLLAWILIRSPIKNLRQVALTLSQSGAQVGSAAGQIASSSEALSQASNHQASSLEQTAASIEQMKAMVHKNSENAQHSADTSRESQRSAQKGQQVVEHMSQAITEINTSNARIMDQINESNRQIADIVKVIAEIGTRTRVINDIVFQTKLLSFNASVEAARAGEHGKGFAVVAEEVGNLAQMSGNAAKEISEMLETSIQKVENIVQDTTEKVESLVAEGRLKVESGTRVAQECGVVLNEIVSNIASVVQMAGEIATASQEQSFGVQEITKAMTQLDRVTQQNAGTSEEVASAAEELSAQSNALNSMVDSLMETIEGKRPATGSF